MLAFKGLVWMGDLERGCELFHLCPAHCKDSIGTKYRMSPSWKYGGTKEAGICDPDADTVTAHMEDRTSSISDSVCS